VRLQQQLADEESAIQEIELRLADLMPFADQWKRSPTDADAPQTSKSKSGSPPERVSLRGADIRIAAVRSLIASDRAATPLHYRDWFEIFHQAGYEAHGADAEATFLTQIGRSPLVQRTSERGVYSLDLDAPLRLRQRLHELHNELAGLHDGQQTIDEIATIADRRAELTRAVVAAERELHEALTSLADGIWAAEPTST
jgi:hypothetical protein